MGAGRGRCYLQWASPAIESPPAAIWLGLASACTPTMKRMILLCGVCGLAALAIFVSLMRPNGARIDAAEIQIAVGNAVPEPDGGSHAQELQLPDPMPSSVAGRNGDQRRPVESPELRLRKSFEARYEGFTFQDLVAEPARARERLAAAQSARFDELHSKLRAGAGVWATRRPRLCGGGAELASCRSPWVCASRVRAHRTAGKWLPGNAHAGNLPLDRPGDQGPARGNRLAGARDPTPSCPGPEVHELDALRTISRRIGTAQRYVEVTPGSALPHQLRRCAGAATGVPSRTPSGRSRPFSAACLSSGCRRGRSWPRP